jgi:hypothetical protein
MNEGGQCLVRTLPYGSCAIQKTGRARDQQEEDVRGDTSSGNGPPHTHGYGLSFQHLAWIARRKF